MGVNFEFFLLHKMTFSVFYSTPRFYYLSLLLEWNDNNLNLKLVFEEKTNTKKTSLRKKRVDISTALISNQSIEISSSQWGLMLTHRIRLELVSSCYTF